MVTSKCLWVSYLLMSLPASTPIVAAPVSRPADLDPGDEGGEQLLDRLQQVLALAGAVGGRRGVAASDQPLAGVVIGGDLGQVLLVEEAELERPVVGQELLIDYARSAVIHP